MKYTYRYPLYRTYQQLRKQGYHVQDIAFKATSIQLKGIVDFRFNSLYS